MAEVMVTGASGGIGRAIVAVLAGAGRAAPPDAYIGELTVLAAPRRN